MAASSRKAARRARFIVRPLFAALVATGVIAPSHGATIVVTTGGDAGTGATCTLRQAIDSINNGSVSGACVNSGDPFGTLDTVDLSGRTGTITLAGATALPVAVNMRVNGPGATVLAISGANASRVFELSTLVTSFEADSITISNGKSVGPGGCIMGSGLTQIGMAGSVVTGCTSTNDPNFLPSPFNGVGGGISAYAVFALETTISGNTAVGAGGGLVAGFVQLYQSRVSGNTVLGQTVDVDEIPTGDKYVTLPYLAGAVLGGGGIAATGPVFLESSVVSDNVVNATILTGTNGESGGIYQYRVAMGGGITQLGLGKYGPPEELAAKSTIAGARGLFPAPTAAKAAQFRQHAALRATAAAKASGRLTPKADGYKTSLGVRNSTISGNRLVGAGPVPENALAVGKYGGGGAAFFAYNYSAEFANATISGNQLPAGGTCSYGSGPPPSGNLFVLTCGGGLAGDSAELSNTTVTGNSGSTAVQFKYGLNSLPTVALSGTSKMLDAHPRLAKAVMQFRATHATVGGRNKSSMKAQTGPVLDSTIVASNTGAYDIGCFLECTLGGANDLIRTAQVTVTLPGGTLTGNPQLAPLANNGGVTAGAPGVTGTGSTRTHALYIGSPAINTGSNLEGFEYDQRGFGFPRTVGGGTDIGAFEGAIAPPNAATPVPAIGPWMLGALSALVGLLGVFRRRRRA